MLIEIFENATKHLLMCNIFAESGDLLSCHKSDIQLNFYILVFALQIQFPGVCKRQLKPLFNFN